MKSENRYFLRLSYLGTNYHGWQIQPGSITVQELLQDALSMVLRSKVSVLGAGRTDTGVHARVFYAHFDCLYEVSEIADMQLQFKLNRILPPDIAVHDVIPVVSDAHARFDAVSRTYLYQIASCKDPYQAQFSWLLERKLDLVKMQYAADILMQYTDFGCFARSNTNVKTNDCKVYKASWEKEGEMLLFKIQADRFLRNMVRAIVGTTVDVGLGKISTDDFHRIIQSKDRCQAGYSAPACGLHLVNIAYPVNIFL